MDQLNCFFFSILEQDADSSDHGSNGDLLGETDFADTHFWDASSSDNEQNIFAESNDDDDDYVDDRPKPKSKKKSKKEKIEEKGTFMYVTYLGLTENENFHLFLISIDVIYANVHSVR